MRPRRVLEVGATVVLVVFVVAMVAGQVLGQPVLLGYVTSDSMEPTISQGDGYVVVPTFLAGEPSDGDVVVFHAKELHDGGLTTHRIVGETDGGYVTKGDNNPFTDQDSNEPPVTDGQIAAVVLEVGGDPVVVPHLGTAIEAVRGAVAGPIAMLGEENAGPVLVGAGILLFLLAGLTGGNRRDTTRRRDRRNVVAIRTLVAVAVIVVVGAATAAMAMPAGVYEFGLVATEDPTDDPRNVQPGGATERTYEIHNGGALPMYVATDPASDGVAVDPRRTVLSGGARTDVSVTTSAPDREGRYLRSVRESRYLLVLPPALLAALHGLHPLAALLAVDAVVAAFVVSASVAVFGTGYLRFRSGPSHVPAGQRLRRRLRRYR